MRDVERLFLMPFVGHFALVVVLYVLLTVLRMRAVRAGRAKVGDFVRAGGDPPLSARVQRNLANQFEAPVIAYFAAAVLLWAGAVDTADVIAAWVFLAGRVMHTVVQVTTDNVALRGQVYMINFLAICVLMGHVAWLTISKG
jgi:hypothetical protein